MQVDFKLHPGQLKVFQDPARFKVVAAGRRWGKSRLSVIWLLTAALENERNGYDLSGTEAWYVAPTYDQAKDIVWQMLLSLGEPVIKKIWQVDGKVQLVNGRSIQIKGSDKPERLRGVGLSDVVLDEFADMKPETWEYILAPTLTDVEGRALFIGSPLGRNHFYELFLDAFDNPDWASYTFTTLDNPFLNPGEIAKARERMTTQAFRQEYEASFDTQGAVVLDPNLVEVVNTTPEEGSIFMAVDPAGYGELVKPSYSKLSKLDETAIAVVQVGTYGWHVLDILHGRWGVRETALQILRAAQKYKPIVIGIEGGALKNALMPYLEDMRRKIGMSANIVTVSHGGKNKVSRITWALQGRMEHGRLTFAPGDYVKVISEQMFDFPAGRHDDLLDALSYVDQVASTVYITEEDMPSEFFYMDEAVGY